MGGFTTVLLRDTSHQNIAKHNALLRLYKVPKKYSFYSEDDVIFEYEAFKRGDGVFPASQFPKDKIHSLNDFKRYWSTEALGEVFVPRFGTLTFDCYFGRTSKRAMRNIGKYLADHCREIKATGGSFETFMQRGMTKLERQIIAESGINHGY